MLCCPDSFKESIGATEAAEAMARGVRAAGAEADVCPLADGGEGTVEALVAATGGRRCEAHVRGPMCDPVEAQWGLLGDGRTAVIEMAAASGLAHVPQGRRDPTQTTTFGTGQLIAAALDAGARRVITGIGGSATNDGGCGAAQALGVRFFDGHDRLMEDAVTGGMLTDIARIDMSASDRRLNGVELIVACDVTNPLTGLNGAAHVYGPQKGASRNQVEQLDAGLLHLAAMIREQIGKDVEHVPGAGAAGGLGAGLLAFCDAVIRPGIDIVLELVRFDQRVAGCDLCLTGEGRLDGQSLAGKTVIGVARAAKRRNVPTIALVGSLGPDHEKTLDAGLAEYVEIGRGLPVERSMARAAELLERETARIVSRRPGG